MFVRLAPRLRASRAWLSRVTISAGEKRSFPAIIGIPQIPEVVIGTLPLPTSTVREFSVGDPDHAREAIRRHPDPRRAGATRSCDPLRQEIGPDHHPRPRPA